MAAANYQNKQQFPPKVLDDGTELPLMNLQGKPYLAVAYRVVWFRKAVQDGFIRTEVIDHKVGELGKKEGYTVVKATVGRTLVLGDAATGRGTPFEQILATGIKTEYEDNFGDHAEKAETGAIGRALGFAGYGTQFDPELEEGDVAGRLADSPIEPAKKTTGRKAKPIEQETQAAGSEGKAPLVLVQPDEAKAGPIGAATQRIDDRAKLQELIQGTAKIAREKGLKTKEELAAMVKAIDANAGASKELDLDGANTFYNQLNQIVGGQ